MDVTESKTAAAISARAVWTVLGNTLALVALLALLWEARLVVGWALFASLLALTANPAVDALERRGVPRGIAVVIMLLAALGVLSMIIGTLVPMIVEQAQALIQRAPEMLDKLAHAPPVRWADSHFGIIEQAQAELREQATTVAVPALAVAASILSGVAATISIVTLTAFMLMFGEDLYRKALLWFPPQRRAHIELLARKMRNVVGGYVLGALLVSSVGGVVMGTTVLLLGVPYFLPLGLVMVLLGLIPLIGSAVGAVLVIGITFASAGFRAALICAVVYLVYQQIENQLLQPLVQKRTIQMNPLLITLVVLAGATLAGVLGTVLALPVAGAIQVYLQDALARRAANYGGAGEQVVPLPADAVPDADHSPPDTL